ncbi:hypothetical protein AWC29_01220 [Mycobacterium triplex]|jgi:hypothetical protein|uniref:Uncharacterized protein n=3 Tax=Mycobacterium TaxID=1763 RepID=A0A024K6M1_9MYCO|nr:MULTISPECIES: hypothetical protein [Mycobacterium]MCA2272550.1 hypothetical protein [Mycobacterium intracellulare]MCA2324711.1 hypothetical protein [Mycobacterium intracellulare]OBH48390.1 hypothetical protein A5690_14580 [Mycobacterium intracellulare]ORA14413.1 hypothetical protein BST14_13770 [Mycobacterium arosiense ATCC BAA-1401 = DSM 45069]ORJ52479.1 hypothetical protein B5M45_31190 [Mycobacterium simiae]
MSRRRGAPWAATSVPIIRRQWCSALEATAEISFDQYKVPPPPDASAHDIATAKRIQRLIARFADTAPIIRAEAQALRTAELYWVARDMVDVVLDAAQSLPEWTPAAALPAPTGMLCWAKSAGTVPSGTLKPDAVEAGLNNPAYIAQGLTPDVATIIDISWDGVWWWSRPDGLLQLVPFSREDQNPEVLRLADTTSPVWAAQTIMAKPDVPRTEEANNTESAHPFVSVVGAAWLLMAQANVAETRTIGSPRPPEPQPADIEDDHQPPERPPREPSTVTIVDLRARAATYEPGAEPGRTYNHRFPVAGHWRQQAWGPNHSWRKPKYIGDYIKGPKGAPLIAPKTRVHVLRKGR